MKPDFDPIVKQFRFEGELIGAAPYGSGHINDTYAAVFKKPDGGTRRYILQRINHRVFKEPEKLMSNIERITRHLKDKITANHGDTERETLNVIPTKSGAGFLKTDEGDYWRGYVFIERARTYDIVENRDHFYNAGRAFGKFQKLLSDFPAGTLFETIPDFHDTRKRYEAFAEAVDRDVAKRAWNVRDEIGFIRKRKNETAILADMLESGGLPLRVTHNDTKFNNVMIDDKTGEGICVIDLDTVMPGLSLYDYGDSIRFGANPAPEDEKDLSKVYMSVDMFEAFTGGFLAEARDFLTPAELECLPFSARLMTLECGIRFLTDYLNGDVYFKVHREGQNLDRCRTQLRMVEDMERKFDIMKKIVKKELGL